MSLRIHILPGLSPYATVVSAGDRALPEPFRSRTTRFYHLGRYAIWHALKALGLGSEASVAFPAFHCGAELIPFVKLGVRVRYYRVDRSLQADLDSLRSTLDGDTKAVFVTHCLGFPQRIDAIQELCAEHDLPLIEDCAHTLNGWYGDRLLGTFGDVAIFSMRKLLPMPDGGALSINSPSIRAPDAATPPPLLNAVGGATLKVGRYIAERDGALGRVFRACIARPASHVLRQQQIDSPRFRSDRADWGMSKLSERILREADLEWVRRRRRENFEWLIENLAATDHAAPLLTSLPDGVCPLMFPVLAQEPEWFVQHLRRRGIQSELYWRYFQPGFPENDFPVEADLKRRLLALPVHQNLDHDALEALIEAVRTA